MPTTDLRKVGGSVMVAVPPALLDILKLGVGANVALEVDNGRLVIEPQIRQRYTMAQLLDASDDPETLTPEDREWVNAPAAGAEPL